MAHVVLLGGSDPIGLGGWGPFGLCDLGGGGGGDRQKRRPPRQQRYQLMQHWQPHVGGVGRPRAPPGSWQRTGEHRRIRGLARGLARRRRAWHSSRACGLRAGGQCRDIWGAHATSGVADERWAGCGAGCVGRAGRGCHPAGGPAAPRGRGMPCDARSSPPQAKWPGARTGRPGWGHLCLLVWRVRARARRPGFLGRMPCHGSWVLFRFFAAPRPRAGHCARTGGHRPAAWRWAAPGPPNPPARAAVPEGSA